MQKVLIPTDFQINSVLLLKQYLQENSNKPVEVTFLYGHQSSFNIHDLLFYKEHEVIEQAITPTFKDAIEILQNKFQNIQYIQYDVFTGVTIQSFENYFEQNSFDNILLIKNYKMKLQNKNSFDFQHLIKSTQNIQFIELEQIESVTNTSLLNIFTL